MWGRAAHWSGSRPFLEQTGELTAPTASHSPSVKLQRLHSRAGSSMPEGAGAAAASGEQRAAGQALASGLNVGPPAGTTAHVGIMLYGAEGRSGHRHLDGDRAFRRNSLDVFQIATPHSLGRVCKIRVWHDNKGLWGRLWRPDPACMPHPRLTNPLPAGLSPAWFLQHVIVRDLQTAHSTFFLVNEWLSVETEANGGLVEKEVPAASKGPSLSLWLEGWP